MVTRALVKRSYKEDSDVMNGNTALAIAKRLGYISVVDTLKVVTEEVTTTTTTITEKHKLNVPETMTEVLDVSDEEGDDTMTGDGGEYLRPEDLKELGDDSLPSSQFLDGMNYLRYSLEGGRSDSLRSFSSDRSHTLSHASYLRDSAMIDDTVVIPSHQVSTLAKEAERNSYRLSWGTENLDNVALSSSPIHSGRTSPCLDRDNSSFLVSFMVDARGGAMRGCRHNGLRIIIPPRKCTAPTRVTCRLVKRHRLATMPPMVEGEGLASRLIEVGPSGAQFLGPVIVEIPHFAALRGKERELVVLRSENGDSWKEHYCEYTEDELNEILNGMDEVLDSPEDLEKKRICRIITRDFPQYFAVVSRIKQDSNLIGPEGGVLSSTVVPQVQAVFPEGALTKRIRVGLQAQPMHSELVKKILGNKATFSPIVTLEPRRRKFHKPITMTIPVPKASSDVMLNGFGGDAPTLRLLCSITGGTTPAQWEDITGTTPLTFVNECVSFTTNVSARFWLIDCRQIQESVTFASQVYREIICVPYMAKFVVFAKSHDPIEARLRCFCMTDDKVDKTLEQQENFAEVARSRDVEVLEGKPIYVDCFGNLVPLTKSGQHHIFSFFAFKENRLPLFVKVRDTTQEPCGRLSFMKEPKSTRGLVHQAICNLNITLPIYTKESESDQEQEEEIDMTSEKNQQDEQERIEERLAYIADHLGFSWTELARELDFTEEQIHQIRIENPNSLQDQSHALLKYWLERDGKHATDTNLIECLTKINRMDIVHLMETISEPLQERISHSYAEIEQTITLDHSEGFSVLQEELCTAQNKQKEEQAASKEGESYDHPPIVSEEDISVGYSTFQDSIPKTEGDGSVTELLPKTHEEQVQQDFSGKMQDLPEESSLEQQEYFVTTPGTEASETPKATAAPGSPSKTPEEIITPPEEERPYLQTPTASEQGDSPIIQEPEEPPEHREASSPRKTSLVIVESADDQPQTFERLDEDAAFQKGDDMPDIPPETVTEEEYVDEHGHTVVKKVTRKIIRRYVSSDGTEKEEMTMQGAPQDPISIEEGDGYSKVIKRVVLKSDTERSEVTLSEPSILSSTSQFQAEPVEGRRVSKVVKTTVVHGERMEKHLGDSSLATDLPSAKDDFEEALSYTGSHMKVHSPSLVENAVLKEDGSIIRRTTMSKARTQKRAVVKDQHGKRIYLEHLEDVPEALDPDDLQHDLQQLLRHFCKEDLKPEAK
ncbi:ankyrin-2 isoform X14 [Phacochoerus africanus]|uniref:ankyrin-2 isoform X14 n=1 Tax=Phacochoerus africanus TaxID=41426 RepID=UPI001FDA1EB8|nr:ankyrin-2 isoform X14 [Phacochoerus africanus]